MVFVKMFFLYLAALTFIAVFETVRATLSVGQFWPVVLPVQWESGLMGLLQLCITILWMMTLIGISLLTSLWCTMHLPDVGIRLGTTAWFLRTAMVYTTIFLGYYIIATPLVDWLIGSRRGVGLLAHYRASWSFIDDIDMMALILGSLAVYACYILYLWVEGRAKRLITQKV